MTPFDATSGTVWEYTDPSGREAKDLYVVLARSHQGLRPYLELQSGAFGRLTATSRWNDHSVLFEPT